MDMGEAAPISLAAVFLDVDGVIDSRKVPYLEATKVERLCRAVAAVPDCVVVISSHWRLVPKQLNTLSTVLQYFGLHVIGVTPSQQPWEPKRPLEIAQWLETYNSGCVALGMPPVTAFVTVDDRDLVNEHGGAALCGRTVHTSRLAGLQECDAEQMIAMLKAQRAAKGSGGGLPPVPGVDACHAIDPSPQSVVTLMNAGLTPYVPLPFVVQLVRYPPAARSVDGAPSGLRAPPWWCHARYPGPPGTHGCGSVLHHARRRGAAAAQSQAVACGAAGGLCQGRSSLHPSTPRPGVCAPRGGRRHGTRRHPWRSADDPTQGAGG